MTESVVRTTDEHASHIVKINDEVASRHVFPLNLFDIKTFGLTKRELFAAMAMQGLASNDRWEADHNVHQTAAEAVGYADALLKELAK